MRNIARSGSWIIPSMRVSYDEEFSLANTKKGINAWQGWANHRKVIYRNIHNDRKPGGLILQYDFKLIKEFI